MTPPDQPAPHQDVPVGVCKCFHPESLHDHPDGCGGLIGGLLCYCEKFVQLAPPFPASSEPNQPPASAEQPLTDREETIRLFMDGNQWCALLGENIQEGFCGFGLTESDALKALADDMVNNGR